MENLINEIAAISKTLETLDIRPTITNMDKLLGCQQHLAGVIDKLREKEREIDGTADPE